MLRSRRTSGRSRSPSYSTDQSSSDHEEDDERGASTTRSTSRRPRKSKAMDSPRSKSTSPSRSPDLGTLATPREYTRISKKWREGDDDKFRHREDREFNDDKIIRWQKLEPKFEPRYAYYRGNPMLNGIKRDAAYYYAHRRKVIEARPVVDNRPPPIYTHVYCNMKKIKIDRERQNAIEKQNKLLLGKLVNAMTSTRLTNRNSNANSRSPRRGRITKYYYQRDEDPNEANTRRSRDRNEVRRSVYTPNENSSRNSEDYDQGSPRRFKDESAGSRDRDEERERPRQLEIRLRSNQKTYAFKN